MWPFQKKSPADQALAVMPEVIEVTRQKWLYFCDALSFKHDVDLATRIASFMVPFEKWLFNNHPIFKQAQGLALLIVAEGIRASDTHTKAQLEQALKCKLPD
jgi:hypothetical protein